MYIKKSLVFNEHWTNFFWWSPASLIFTMSGFCFKEFLTYQKTCVSVAAACIWCRQSDRPSLANCWRTHWLLPSGKIDGILKQALLYNVFERRCIKKCSALLRLHVHTSCLIWQFDELFCCGHPNKQILKSTNNTFYWSVLLDFL